MKEISKLQLREFNNLWLKEMSIKGKLVEARKFVENFKDAKDKETMKSVKDAQKFIPNAEKGLKEIEKLFEEMDMYSDPEVLEPNVTELKK